MGTGGYKAWRFRKRYYVEYNGHDSYPDGLGSWIADTVPSDHEAYMRWLDKQRLTMEAREARLDRHLAVKIQAENSTSSDDSSYECDEEYEEDPRQFIVEEQPIWLAPLNDLFIEWVYIIDLDREIFSVNNGAHFKLGRLPYINWIESLADGRLGDKIILPFVPKEDTASLMVDSAEAKCDVGDNEDLHVCIARLCKPLHSMGIR